MKITSSSFFQKALRAWCVVSAVLGLSLLGGYSLAAANPPRVDEVSALAAASGVTVSPCTGGACVNFALAYANATFGNGISASSRIQVTTEGCVLIDATGFCASKSPQTWPGATINITYWNPTVSIGTLAIFTAVAPTTSTLSFKVAGATLGNTLLLTKDGAYFAQTPVTATGNGTFFWYVNSASDPRFEIDVLQGLGGPGVPGLRILPSFDVSRFFSLFDASSDELVQFHDTSTLSPPLASTRLWKFGDGSFSSQRDPMHRYNYSFASSFDVSLTVCSGTNCNMTTQSVLMTRPHMLILATIILGTTVIALVEIWRYGKKQRR